MSSKSLSRETDFDHAPQSARSKDAELCQRILGIDMSIRAAAIIDGTTVTGFAMTQRTGNLLGVNPDIREKMGYWVRMVTEIARQTEPLFGGLESITFKHGRLKLITIPLSKTRSLGFSVDKSADENSVLPRIQNRLDLKSS